MLLILKPNKRLGQHFLISEHALETIVGAMVLRPQDDVVEIGCGPGVLTARWGALAGRVMALEVDRGLVAVAKEVCRDLPNVSVLHEDALTADPSSWVNGPFKVVGNLPYYITSPLLARIVAWKWDLRLPVTETVVMVQREVAARMTAPPGGSAYGSFSVFIQFWAEVSKVCHVPAGAFDPVPDVGSTVLRLVWRDRQAVSVEDAPAYFEIVHAAFGQRRKMLRQALKTHWPRGSAGVEEACREAGVEATARAEELDLKAFARLTRAWKEASTSVR